MKVILLGAGFMGKAIAKDLVRSEGVNDIVLVDADCAKAQQVAASIASDKLRSVELRFENDEALKEVLQQGDVIINAMFYSHNERIARLAIAAGVHSIDLGGSMAGATDAVFALHEEAKAAGITIIPELGVTPGMTNILTGYGASKLDKVEEIKLYAGDIPVEPIPPIDYIEVFSIERMFDYYSGEAKGIYKWKEQEYPSMSGCEPIYFDEFGVLEAFYTAGGISTLADSYPNVKTLTYKTVRYKGHAEKMKLLVDLGLFDIANSVKIDGKTVNVRKVIREALSKKLEAGKKADVLLVRVLVSGDQAEQQVTNEYELVLKRSAESEETAMAKATASSVSIVAQMVANGTITTRGVSAPEQVVPGEVYIEEMAKRNIRIKETIHRSSMIVKG
ncbi:Lysine 6-dehydrogenase [Metalysinibacillus saudimassiliensis]|uniref:Lysine 6-dehydrogenase n=1 Tax=Metalysinibacillus saudimassiliensis TaxID=1461583 RepID=A0A078M9N1_9BACL|nr:Lysine 6-dehydrogenase [Metalysinibacillus saudimassiliensis]